MRCLMCDKEKWVGSLVDIMMPDDPLCEECRKKWEKKRFQFLYDGIPIESTYIYNEAFSKCLIQYKEYKDEALKDVFLFGEKLHIFRKYYGYTVVLLPSSQQKEKERGFNHLREMFRNVKLPMLDALYKLENVDQKELSILEREKMKGLIGLKEGIDLPKKVLLVDDTITTGATLSGALRCIRKKCKKIRIYTVSYNRRWL